MKKIVFLTPADAVNGFRLAGVRQHAAQPTDVAATLLALAAEPSTGLLAIDERFVDASVQRQLDDIEQRWPALVVVLPAPTLDETPAEDYALRLIRRAIGYQVRVNV